MSDNIPFDIQLEIIKKVSDVKSLIQFRSVSKPWKSLIDSSDFIKGYGARHTQPRSHILSYAEVRCGDDAKFIRLVEDDKNETFKVKEQELSPAVVSPLIKQFSSTQVVGICHGLVCLFGLHEGYDNWMVVIWNPCIGKSFGSIVPKCVPQTYKLAFFVFGFGVCPVTSDPTVVRVFYGLNLPWHVEVFTLSSGVWNVIPSGNLPRQSITLGQRTHVVIDRFIYWGAYENTFDDDGNATVNHMVVSFDLITKEFKVVDLPDTVTNKINGCVSVSKLRQSLVVYGTICVYGTIYVEGAETRSLWVMQHDSSFKKLFSIGARVDKRLGFRESGEPIIETPRNFLMSTRVDVRDLMYTRLQIYDPCSQQIINLGIDGRKATFFMGSYKESLLLLDHSDLHIYCDDNQ